MNNLLTILETPSGKKPTSSLEECWQMDSKIAVIPALGSQALVQFSPLTCEWGCDLLPAKRTAKVA